jgi:hypothetical protein
VKFVALQLVDYLAAREQSLWRPQVSDSRLLTYYTFVEAMKLWLTILIMQFRDLLGILPFEHNLKIRFVESGNSRKPGPRKLRERVQIQAIQHQTQCIEHRGCADQDGQRGAGQQSRRHGSSEDQTQLGDGRG